MRKDAIECIAKRVVLGVFVAAAVVCGGSKHPQTAPTSLQGAGAAFVRAHPLSAATIAANWNSRGAWRDSFRFDFADGWVFPWSSNHLAGVEVVSWGEVRPAWNDTNAIARLGVPVSIVPGLTTFAAEYTPSNTYRFAWTDAAANRDTNTLITAAIELFRNGDWCVTTNGAARWGQRALPFPHDGYGQDAEWVAANFTNATEILQQGYVAWVDAQVGEGLTNGLYKLTVGVAEDPPETTLVTVGDYSVAVTNAGEYVFLLEKGLRYALSASSDCVTNFSYTAVDDVPTGRIGGANAPRRVAPATEYGRWSEDKGRSVVVRPPRGTPAEGWSIWTPQLTVSPQTWRPSWSERSQTFTAMAYDVSPFASKTYRWSSRGGAAVAIDSPAEGRTAMRCNFPYESGEMIDLSLTMEAMGETLQVEYRCPVGAYDSGDWEEVCDYTGTNAPPVGVSVSASPSVVFFDAGAATGLTANVACHYCVREAGTLTLHIADGGNCTVKNADGATVADGYTWSAGEDTRGARFFMVTGNWESNTPSGTVFRVTYAPEAGEDTVSDEVSVTFVEVTVFPDEPPRIVDRRELGVCERASIRFNPVPAGLRVANSIASGSVTPDTNDVTEWRYQAPMDGCTDIVGFSAADGSGEIALTIREPTGYVVLQCQPYDFSTNGVSGEFFLDFMQQLAPTNVSFRALDVQEEGLVATNVTGYFAAPARTNWLDHAQNGAPADKWTKIEGDQTTHDWAGCREIAPPWGEGGSFTWPVPNWWRIRDRPEHKKWFCSTDQTFELDADGTVHIHKFGWVGICPTNRNAFVIKEE